MGGVVTAPHWNKLNPPQRIWRTFITFILNYPFPGPSCWLALPQSPKMFNKKTKMFYWIPLRLKGTKNETTTSSNCDETSEWLPHHAALESPQCPTAVILSTGLFPKSKKGKEKRRCRLLVFWMDFLKYRQAFLTETMARVHPAAFSLLLSLPARRASICLWAETHGASCSTQRTSQKFTSCSSTHLLRTDPGPRTRIRSPSRNHVDVQTRWWTSALSADAHTSPSVRRRRRRDRAAEHVLQRRSGIIFALPSWADLWRQWKLILLFQW